MTRRRIHLIFESLTNIYLNNAVPFWDGSKRINMEVKERTHAFEIVKSIIGKSEDLLSTDYVHYFIISTPKTHCWVCRISSTDGVNTISFPVDGYKGEANVELKTIDEISNYSDYIISAFNTALTF